jgi:hypothetical protein
MAITNQERIGKAMELLRAGLAPFVAREFRSQRQAQAAEACAPQILDPRRTDLVAGPSASCGMIMA